MRRSYFFISLLLIPLMVTSCGFHLRGSAGTKLGLTLSRVVVEGIETESGFGLELIRVLRANNVDVIPLSKRPQPPPSTM
jgi:outer membrane lipopolysaccharide assembly protein LptE/RlpB